MTVSKRRTGRPVEPFELTAEEKGTLERYARGRTVSQGLAPRARIVLACAEKRLNGGVVGALGITVQTVGK
jgi:hypothetical protein